MTKILGADMLPLIRQKLPTKTSQLTNDSGFITSSSLSHLVPNTRTVNGKALAEDITIDIPTKVSQLTNDSRFVTNSTLNSTVQTLQTAIEGKQEILVSVLTETEVFL